LISLIFIGSIESGSSERTARLAGLAEVLQTEGLDDEEIVRRMQEHFCLERLAASTRVRFEAAVKLSVTMRQV
jgi:hypothetical protein